MNTKLCTGPCGEEKPATLEFFYRQKNGKYDLGAECKQCQGIRKKSKQNPPNTDSSILQTCSQCSKDFSATTKFFHKKGSCKFGVNTICKTCVSNQKQSYYQENNIEIREKRKTHYSIHKDRLLEDNKKYRSEPRNKKRTNRNKRTRRLIDPLFRLDCNLRSRIRKSVVTKSNSSYKLLGVSMNEYCVYIEKQFDEGMSWENYGAEWHIDHIIPINNYNLLEEQEQSKAFNWRNTRPLFVNENLGRSKDIDYNLVAEYQIKDLLPSY